MLWTYKSISCTVRLHCCHLVRDDRKRELSLGNDTISHISNITQLLHMCVHKHLADPNLWQWSSNSSSSCLGEVAHLSGRSCQPEKTRCCAASQPRICPFSLATASECLWTDGIGQTRAIGRWEARSQLTTRLTTQVQEWRDNNWWMHLQIKMHSLFMVTLADISANWNLRYFGG